MKTKHKCDNCEEEFFIFVDLDEWQFCPVCNSSSIREVKNEDLP